MTYEAAAINDCKSAMTFDHAQQVVTGPASITVPLYSGSPLTVAPGSELSATIHQKVPPGAPLGTYTVAVELSLDGEPVSRDSFDVDVE